MKLNTIQMAAQIPSGFGMPACGHATASVTGSAAGIACRAVMPSPSFAGTGPGPGSSAAGSGL